MTRCSCSELKNGFLGSSSEWSNATVATEPALHHAISHGKETRTMEVYLLLFILDNLEIDLQEARVQPLMQIPWLVRYYSCSLPTR